MNKRVLFSLFFVVIAVFFLVAYQEERPKQYFVNQGYIFGTYYNIRYEASRDYESKIQKRLQQFDGSLSTFNPQSVISRINQNATTKTDEDFRRMYTVAQQVSEASHGAFDITVAPLVNAWGFGFQNKEQVSPALLDSLLPTVGYQKIHLRENCLIKDNPQTLLDASAVAKGQACDVIADWLRAKGVENLLVDIGGEVVLQGVNPDGEPWRVGISKPQDNLSAGNNEIEKIISSTALCMATSGNYRQFYYEDGVRRSHTIDPRTGYPVQHSLLSATITAPTCAEADALATACMVLGTDSALMLINALPDTECLLIVSRDSTYQTIFSDGWSL